MSTPEGLNLDVKTELRSYGTGSPPLLDATFLARYDGVEWAPASDDKQAPAKLHTQRVSRISTQRLPYLDGVEQTALDSPYGPDNGRAILMRLDSSS